MKIMKWSLVFCTTLLLFGCGKKEIVGTEKIMAQVRNVSEFSSLQVNGFYDVNITIGAPQSVTVHANGNLLPYIETTVSSHTLTVNDKKGYLLRPSGVPIIDIITPEIAKIAVNGNNQVTLRGVAKGDLEVNFAGSNQLVGQGRLDRLKITLDGNSTIEASKLVANDVEIESNGTAKIIVFPKNKLKVKISGSGMVNYLGDPKIEQVINGSASITKMPAAALKQ